MSLAKTTRVWLVGAVVVGSAVAMAHVVSSPASPAPSANFVRHIRAAYARLPLAFEANRGQTDPQVRFLARGRGYTVFLTPTEAVLTLVDPRQAALAGG